MTQEEILAELKIIASRKIVYGGAYVVIADQIENLIEKIKENDG